MSCLDDFSPAISIILFCVYSFPIHHFTTLNLFPQAVNYPPKRVISQVWIPISTACPAPSRALCWCNISFRFVHSASPPCCCMRIVNMLRRWCASGIAICKLVPPVSVTTHTHASFVAINLINCTVQALCELKHDNLNADVSAAGHKSWWLHWIGALPFAPCLFELLYHLISFPLLLLSMFVYHDTCVCACLFVIVTRATWLCWPESVCVCVS